MGGQLLRADGSAYGDRPEPVVIDLTNEADRWRYTCPNGHRDWSRTNSHIFCYSCSRQVDVDPEHYELHDKAEDRDVPWSAVQIID